ncbi:hypothetical protein RRG08_029885 [Elysia crispata]|uniref:Uncharacterized protein n=1 Tax=Elysia crispata TaxID=231223 RepID=A0AAE1D0I9_9GAST|nr:hypothetical protein RRG08_029885 [Elysia crispata]
MSDLRPALAVRHGRYPVEHYQQLVTRCPNLWPAAEGKELKLSASKSSLIAVSKVAQNKFSGQTCWRHGEVCIISHGPY